MRGLSKVWTAAAVIAAAVVVAGCATQGGSGLAAQRSRAVLMIAWEGSADLEIAVVDEAGVMLDLLEAGGYRVVVATKSGAPLATATRTIAPDLRIAEVRPADYAGLIMPCMNAGTYRTDKETAAVIKAIAARGRPVAAQRGAVSLLGEAGVLAGRSYSAPGPFLPSSVAHYVSDRVVVDGNIITSGGCPYSHRFEGTTDGTRALTEKFMALL